MLTINLNDIAESSDWLALDIFGLTHGDWVAGALTADDLGSVIVAFDYLAAPGVTLDILLIPDPVDAGYWGRLELGTLRGSGQWVHHAMFLGDELGNEINFLALMNEIGTTDFRLQLGGSTPGSLLHDGSSLMVDNLLVLDATPIPLPSNLWAVAALAILSTSRLSRRRERACWGKA